MTKSKQSNPMPEYVGRFAQQVNATIARYVADMPTFEDGSEMAMWFHNTANTGGASLNQWIGYEAIQHLLKHGMLDASMAREAMEDLNR